MSIERFVASVTDLSSPFVPSDAQSSIEVVRVTFTNQQSGLLARNTSLAVQHLRLLESMRVNDVLTYAEIDDGRITDVDVPTIDRVVELSSERSGDVLVWLESCPTVLIVRNEAPNKDQLGLALKRAKRPDGAPATIVWNRSSRAIRYAEVPESGKPPCAPTSPKLSDVEIVNALAPVSRDALDAFVVREFAATCDTANPCDGCIPYTFGLEYCWVRAHLLCRRLDSAGISAAKLWVYAQSRRTLRVPSDCVPQCVTSWSYHVVPVVRTESLDMRVLDPCLFHDRSVSVADFMQILNPGTFQYTKSDVYRNNPKGDHLRLPPEIVEKDRQFALNKLKATLSDPDGPPPYRFCRRRPFP